MGGRRFRHGVFAALVVVLLAAPGKADKLPKADLARLGKSATAFVEVNNVSSGSAFCVHPSGIFITNEHVVRGASDVTLVLNATLKDQKVLKAKVLRHDAVRDLALLQVKDGKELPALSLGSDEKIAELLEVVAFGFPFGQRLASQKGQYPAISVNAGTVTSLRNMDGVLHRIQLDVELNSGNSGGPILDHEGKVVGVVASGVRGARVNFAIPVSHLAKFLETPEFVFEPPTITEKTLYEPTAFKVRVVSVLPTSRPLSVDMILTAGDSPERRVVMDLKEGFFTATTAPVVKPTTRRIDLSAQFETGALSGIVTDREIQVGSQKVSLRNIRRIQSKPKPQALLVDGKTIEGEVTGLGKIELKIGGQTLNADLGRATIIQVEAVPPVVGMTCTFVARDKDREIGRLVTDIPVRGAQLVTPVDPSTVAIKAPTLAAEKITKMLPDSASEICVGGGGRYLILQLPKQNKLAIFDVNEAAIVRYIPLNDDRVIYAAGLQKLLVGLVNKGVLERWDIATGEKEAARNLPLTGKIGSVLMGSGSSGPVVVNGAFLDVQSFRPLPIKAGPGGTRTPVSGDGTVFAGWNTNLSPASSATFVLQGDEIKRHEGGHQGHVVPGPDGRLVFTARGVFTNQFQAVPGAPKENAYCLPAVEGAYYMSLSSADGPNKGGLSIYMLGNEAPLLRQPNFGHGIRFDGWDREEFGPWKRLFLIPRAKLIVVFPPSNDRLELRRFDIEEALEKSSADYLLVTSRPPATAKRGAELTYQLVVKSKKGSVKYELSAAPKGMTLSPDGLLSWKVPSDIKDTDADIIVTVRDASGQEVFHTFKVRLAD